MLKPNPTIGFHLKDRLLVPLTTPSYAHFNPNYSHLKHMPHAPFNLGSVKLKLLVALSRTIGWLIVRFSYLDKKAIQIALVLPRCLTFLRDEVN
ncbi:hypothetical protein WA026_003467 [Henosepilachna vigintioctopunctata]|uniref:Uncharacterized protein n=1 Tax=Henosepilachna vigintioctopunctata TaxID=420089 RepID=A0AAW1TM82_9CUCU